MESSTYTITHHIVVRLQKSEKKIKEKGENPNLPIYYLDLLLLIFNLQAKNTKEGIVLGLKCGV
jgi:hypothetical protein